MTQKQAIKAKGLAKPLYKAIQATAGERKCEECKGTRIGKHTSIRKRNKMTPWYPQCKTCNGTGKVGWKWKPEVGEWYMIFNTLRLIDCVPLPTGIREEAIPILPWETIEQILEGVGYGFGVWRTPAPIGFRLELYCLVDNPNQDPTIIIEGAKSRTEAVYKAVIELSKCISQ